jgi:hypothetical protein
MSVSLRNLLTYFNDNRSQRIRCQLGTRTLQDLGLLSIRYSVGQRAIESLQASHQGIELPDQRLPIEDFNMDGNEQDLLQERLESLVREQEEFVASLNDAALIELNERTDALIEAGFQKAIRGVPGDVQTEISKLMKSDREKIHQTMKQAAIQQMMSEAQNQESVDSLNLERINEPD